MNNEIIIVSGLPRSGTSLMMQMLDAGGIEAMTDKLRTPDNSNPQGYFEYEPVKKLASDNSWVKNACGKSVKVIAQLLQYLPDDFQYKVIFMERNLDEVLRSQQVMLGKGNTPAPVVIGEVFKKQLVNVQAWMENKPNVSYIKAVYSHIVADPSSFITELESFLGRPLDREKMTQAVNPSLYRNKVG